MKKLSFALSLIFALTLLSPTKAYANMAAPTPADIGSAITFEQNENIAVLSEVIDITVSGDSAKIEATYNMKNLSDSAVSTQSMFLSPNIKDSAISVTVKGEPIDFLSESYTLNLSTDVDVSDWEFVVLNREEQSHNNNKTVDTISFLLSFNAKEEIDIIVSYDYELGGYPNLDFSAKRGEIEYYLTPAALWQDFSNLTINLYLDEDMPVISHSNLKFEEIDTAVYQYSSDKLPSENLIIHIDENWYQNIWSTLRSPYLSFSLLLFSPLILFALIVIIIIISSIRKKARRRK